MERSPASFVPFTMKIAMDIINKLGNILKEMDG
jgi:hypothetical protein